MSFEEITPFLQDSYAKEPEMFVALYADETVPYKEIVRILNIANQNKFKMVLATRPNSWKVESGELKVASRRYSNFQL